MKQSNCSGLCCGWILGFNLCEKIWQYKCVHGKAYLNVLFGSEYIVNGYHISSSECNKVVSDILGEIELFTDIESLGKMTDFKP